jgi:hypothetical protein
LPLTQEQKDLVTAWRRDKGIDRCLACGYDGEMQCGDIVIAPIPNIVGSIQVGQEMDGIGMVPVVCPNCAHMMLHEPVVMGLGYPGQMGGLNF